MKKPLSSTVILIIGIVIFLLGCIQPFRYDAAKENGYEIDATIVEIIEEEETDSEGTYTSTSYTIYADYEVDGKAHTHVKVGKFYVDKYSVGNTIKVVVDPDSPGSSMYEGGILATIGFLVMCYGIIKKIRERKIKNAAASSGD